MKKDGTFKYRGTFPKYTSEKDKYDFSAKYYYDDAYFLEDSRIYNPHLSTMSLCLGLSSWSSYDADQERYGWSADIAAQNARELLTGYSGIGFKGFKYNYFWNFPPTKNSIGAAAANKKLIDCLNDDEYTLIALTVRGGGYYSEWASNFTLGISGQHEGFCNGKNNVIAFLSEYINEEQITGKIKLWVVGYSRGGAVANLIAGELNEGYPLPHVTLFQEDLFAYTFEAPQGAMISQNSDCHKNIHNVINLNDIVPLVAQTVWNFTRYNGSSWILPSAAANSDFSSRKSEMLKQYYKLEGMNSIGYKIDEYTRSFEVQVDWRKILPGGDPSIKLVVVSDTGYPQSQLLTDTITDLSDLIGPQETARVTYVDNFQTGIEYIMEVNNSYYSHEKECLNRAFAEFSFDDIEHIIAPVYNINPFYSKTDRVKDIEERLMETVAIYYQSLGMSLSKPFLNSTMKLIASYIFSYPVRFAKFADNFARGSITQAHIPEVCFAWLRSQDSNYTSTASFNPSSSVSRIIHINCPADISVYDSNNRIIASIVNNAPQDMGSGIIAFVNGNKEKIVYLPPDGEYSVIAVSTGYGEMTFTINELNLMSGSVERVTNYYNIPTADGDIFKGIIPAFTSDELITENLGGSSAVYQLVSGSGADIPMGNI